MTMYPRLKRLLDLVFGLIFFLLCLPLFIIVSLVIFVFDNQFPLFSQERSGLQGEPFVLYKFRTMRKARCHSELHATARITLIGHILRASSLDELPQLFNIIKGQMSFVGPRPLLPQYLSLYTPQQLTRLNVRPGLTGLSQVSGRNRQSWASRFAYDSYYVRNLSFHLDLIILLKTFWTVFCFWDSQSSSSSIMAPFNGDN